jgi:hypothetical protein
LKERKGKTGMMVAWVLRTLKPRKVPPLMVVTGCCITNSMTIIIIHHHLLFSSFFRSCSVLQWVERDKEKGRECEVCFGC